LAGSAIPEEKLGGGEALFAFELKFYHSSQVF